MMSHPLAHDFPVVSTRGVVDGFVEPERSQPVRGSHAAEIADGFVGIDLQRKKRRVGRNDGPGIGFEGQGKMRNAVSMVTIVPGIVFASRTGFGDSPRNAERTRKRLLYTNCSGQRV